MGNYFSHSKGGKKAKHGFVTTARLHASAFRDDQRVSCRHITEVDRAILSLKTQRRKLEDQSALIEQRIEHNLQVARELIAAAKKDRALLALKKKKMNEQQLQSLQAWLINVEDILNNMELRQQQNRVFNALKEGNTALKTLQKEFTLEDVERLKEDTAEAQAYQDEVNAALSEALTEVDTEAVLQELDELEAEAAAAEVEQLPAAPTTQVEVETPAVEAAAAEAEAQAEAGGAAAGVSGVEALREAASKQGKPLVAEEPMVAKEPMLAA